MPIRAYLGAHVFDAETVRVLGLAFEIAQATLEVEHGNETARKVIAAKLIGLAEQGERNPDRLAEVVLAMIDIKSLPPRTFQQQVRKT
jgi:hypothetical protein